jgi:hypothetical protein
MTVWRIVLIRGGGRDSEFFRPAEAGASNFQGANVGSYPAATLGEGGNFSGEPGHRFSFFSSTILLLYNSSNHRNDPDHISFCLLKT